MKRLYKSAAVNFDDISGKDVVNAFLLDLEKNYDLEFLANNTDLVYELTHIEDDYDKSVHLAEFYVKNINVNNFFTALEEVMNDKVDIEQDDVQELILPIKRFYNYTNKMPFDIIEADVEVVDNSLDE